MSRHRNICMTINVHDGEEDLRFLDPSEWPHCTFFIQSRELGQREHLQAYAEFDAPMSFSALHKLPGLEDAHFEPRRGTQQQAIDYCQKVADPTHVEGPEIFGVPKHQGQRNDILNAVGDLKAGHSLKRVAEDNPEVFIKFSSGLAKYQMITARARGDFEQTTCFVFYGSGGSGKSSFARRLARFLDEEGKGVYTLPFQKNSGLYWDRYEQGQVVIIDEFKGDRMKPTFFNSLVDRGQFEVPTHGGTTQFNSKYIIITTNVAPREWWPNISYLHSLRRRIVIWPIFRNLSYVARPRPQFLFNGAPMAISQQFRVPE